MSVNVVEKRGAFTNIYSNCQVIQPAFKFLYNKEVLQKEQVGNQNKQKKNSYSNRERTSILTVGNKNNKNIAAYDFGVDMHKQIKKTIFYTNLLSIYYNFKTFWINQIKVNQSLSSLQKQDFFSINCLLIPICIFASNGFKILGKSVMPLLEFL
ncbi:unnamed protein product [Paramecium primaurelia]|uniref:Transmembrane protein n=1 Tax=Paramecium primaurelia TaxID=5886 RepID=A0A8S1QRI8_PARPR|nr:unnamed protein product [Paramecium primaurelia]